MLLTASTKETLIYLLHAIDSVFTRSLNLKNPANLVLNAQGASSSQDAYCCALWLLPPLSYCNSTIKHVFNTLPLPNKHWIISRMLSQTPHDAFSTQKPYNALSSSHNKLDFKNSVKPLKNEEGGSSSHDAYYCAPLLLPRHFLLHIE